ncbi:MAG: hypothetical protein J6A04_05715 [Clostridia bacterium]|nr:hypothetical protein [Clostridia bacterium]
MNHKKMMAIILCMIIIIIGIIILTIFLIKINKEISETTDFEDVIYNDVEQVTNKTTFFRVDNCINQYISNIKLKNENAYLSINKNTNIEEYGTDSNFYSKEMHSIDKVFNITVFVKGYLRNEKEQKEKYYIVNLDYNNNTFEIIDSSVQEYTDATNNQIKEKYKEVISIQNNSNNTISSKEVTDFQILKKYFDDYKFKAINTPEVAFQALDTEYRKTKFNNSLEQYKLYIQNNINTLQDANIVKHGITKEDGYTKYIFIDNYNNYYELKETGIYEYTITLDNYTVQTKEQTAKYNKLTDEEKALSNIDKVMKLIDQKDYTAVYNYLNEDFKNTNFPTIESFTKYIKENFFENNIVGKIGIKAEGNIFMLSVPYKESLSTAAEEMEKTFIMKLKEGTNFELSFEM